MTRALFPAALLLVIAGCAPASAPRSPAVAPSAASAPSADPTASPSAAAPTRLTGVARRLSPGRYVYDMATPHVTLEVPANWYLSEAMPRHFGLHPGDVLVDEAVRTWFDMRVASTDPTCPEIPQSGIGHSATDLVAAFTSDPRLRTSRPAPISIGGLEGQVVDIGLAVDWTASCPFSDGVPSVPLFLDDDVVDEPAFWGVSGPERLRLMVLHDGRGSNVVIMLDSTNGATLDELEATVRPVLDTFRFTTGG
jgi:hypothetical protein